MKLSREQGAKIAELLRGVATILETASNGAETTQQTPDPKATVETKTEAKKGHTPKEEEEVVSTDRATELNAMTFNDVKALAKTLGLKAVGTKAQLIEKIMDAEDPSEIEEVEEIKEIEESNVKVGEEVEEELEEEEETLADRVARELADTSDADLKDILSDIGIKAIGKRQTLVDKIVKAVEDGLLDFDGEEEVEEEQEEEEEEIPGSDERVEAMETLQDELTEQYENKEITDKEIADFLKAYYGNKPPKASKEEKLADYISIQCNLIDDDGDQHDLQDAYYVGEDVHCCGLPTKEIESGNQYCEVCGQEYEV